MTLACFYPHFVFFSSMFLSENLFIPLFLGSLLLFLRAADRGGGWPIFRAGLVAGAAALVRPAILGLAPVALHAIAKRGPGWGGRLRAAGILAAGGLTIIGPWAARNRIAYDRLVIVAPNSGVNFYIGNNPRANGSWLRLPDDVPQQWADTGYYFDRALDFVRADPWAALEITLRRKWQHFWEFLQPWPLHSTNAKLFIGDLFFPMPSWRLVLILGGMGMGFVLSAGRRPVWIIPACVAAYVAFYMVFFANARMRLPVEGLFLATAGVAVVALARGVAPLRRARAPAWAAAIVLLVAAALAQSALSGARAREAARDPSLSLWRGDPTVLGGVESASTLASPRLDLDRGRGTYLRLSWTALRETGPRFPSSLGQMRLTYYDAGGRELDAADRIGYHLETLALGRWYTMAMKSAIPARARSCSVSFVRSYAFEDRLTISQPVLRYARGDDLALEFVFPYLSWGE